MLTTLTKQEQQTIREKNKLNYFPYILQLLHYRTMPRHYSHDNGQGFDNFYVWSGLPNGRVLVYESGNLKVALGVSTSGFPSYDKSCAPYSASGLKKILGRDYSKQEREVVLMARELVKRYRREYH